MRLSIQNPCQSSGENFSSNINWFIDCRKIRLTIAPHKKAPLCVFEWRGLLTVTAERVFFGADGKTATRCDQRRSAARDRMAQILLPSIPIETVSTTRTTLAFTHIPSVGTETCRACAPVSAA